MILTTFLHGENFSENLAIYKNTIYTHTYKYISVNNHIYTYTYIYTFLYIRFMSFIWVLQIINTSNSKISI